MARKPKAPAEEAVWVHPDSAWAKALPPGWTMREDGYAVGPAAPADEAPAEAEDAPSEG